MGLVARLLLVVVLVVGLGGASASASARPVAPPAGVLDYQLGGAYAPVAAVRIVDRDRTDRPVPGRYNICYVNGFQTQPNERRFWTRSHRSLLLRVRGRFVHDPNWPGEYVLDTSTAAKRRALLTIVGRWFDGCARRGFDAVEPDNLDSWTRQGVRGAITRADNLAFAKLLVRRAHARGLAVAQKNTVEVSRQARRLGFDFAIAEQCEVYRECGGYARWYGSRVLEIEYSPAAFTHACANHRGRMSITLRDLDVVPREHRGYVFRAC